MQRNECKPGTKVIIRGTIKEDDGTSLCPIIVAVHNDKHQEENVCFEPSLLEAVLPKYDPARKYRKGDLVRITGYHGRLFGMGDARKLSGNNTIGIQVELIEDEYNGGTIALPAGILSDGYNMISVACIELVKPIEGIEAEQSYMVKDVGTCFQVRKGGNYIYEIFWESNTCPKSPYSKGEALRKAQELCDELNRKHRESMNA